MAILVDMTVLMSYRMATSFKRMVLFHQPASNIVATMRESRKPAEIARIAADNCWPAVVTLTVK